jgi:hypothetical protein
VPDHPDHEQLAAYQAGDGDRRRLAAVEAHLAGCPSCAEVVASVERARGRLALLAEPDLPSGLHDRLATALDAEAAKAPATRPAPRAGGLGHSVAGSRRERSATGSDGSVGRRPRRAGSGGGGAVPGAPRAGSEGGGAVPGARPVPWYRRRVAWGAAAALLLAALVAVPLLDRPSNLTTASGGGSGGQDLASPEAAGAGSVPLIRVPGEISAATVRARLATDTRAKAALDSAATRPGAQAAAPGGAEGGASATQPPGRTGESGASATQPSGQAYRPRSGGPQASAATLRSCLTAATAAADPATRPLTPAFVLEGAYHGRRATILVTASTGRPGRVDLWVFPRDGCAAPPLATERVR